MKKLLISFIATALLTSCFGGKTEQNQENQPEVGDQNTQNEEVQINQQTEVTIEDVKMQPTESTTTIKPKYTGQEDSATGSVETETDLNAASVSDDIEQMEKELSETLTDDLLKEIFSDK